MLANPNKHKTREEWLVDATSLLASDLFEPIGETVPAVHVSVGIPKGRSGKSNQAIGQCWAGVVSDDKQAHIFICPSQVEPLRVLDILAHELIHAIYPLAGHKGEFKRVAKAIGLTGKMTATIAGEELAQRLNNFIDNHLGNYPHAKLSVGAKQAGGKKKQSTRMLKATCQCCEYTVRITKKWADIGLPHCPAHLEEGAMILG